MDMDKVMLVVREVRAMSSHETLVRAAAAAVAARVPGVGPKGARAAVEAAMLRELAESNGEVAQ